MRDNGRKVLDILEIMRPEIKIEECSSTEGKIIFEPLERGYGVTIGNALRRVLLSSIKGAAITSVRIEGVLHEFSTIPGVREDVIELMLNLKHVPVRSYSPEVRVLRLEIDGPQTVTASMIQPDSEVEFVDPDAYICTLEEGAHLSMDLYVEQGVGYATIDRGRPAYLPADALLIDAIFSPVQRVQYEVQAARVGQRTDYDRLVLDIWTNGVVEPDLAVCEAAKIVRSYFGMIIDDIEKVHPNEHGESYEEEGDEVFKSSSDAESDGLSEEQDLLLSRPVRELELSIRSENCLLRGGIHTIGDLLSKSRDDLLKIRNLGKISLREIEEKIFKLGLQLRNDKAEDNMMKEE
jgi:DNA-directed RNA polymerase subunit alpha